MDYTEFLRDRIDESDSGLPATELERLIVDLHVSIPGRSASCEECDRAWPCPSPVAVSRAYVHHPDFPPDLPNTWAS